jgi:trk system potassium uptake protein TrkA
MAKRVLVIGLGRFGAAVAHTLAQEGCDVIAVDTSMSCVDAIKDRVTYALELDGSDPIALRSIDVHTCSVAVVAIGENFEATALSVAALKEVGVPLIVARAPTPRHARILEAVGAHRVVELEAEMGRALGHHVAVSDPAALAMQAVQGVPHVQGVPPMRPPG